MIIDAHQHFWAFDPRGYAWIEDAGLAALRRDFLPGDLGPLLDARGVTGSVAVQARQSVEETEWLLSLAGADGSILGVVGWADLAGDAGALDERLARWRRGPGGLVGLRHVIQDEPAGFMAAEAFRAGVARLAGHGLAYDLLIHARQLDEAVAFVDALPEDLRVVLDHCAKPEVRRGEVHGWRRGIDALAAKPNVSCKLSGLVTEADHGGWTREQLTPYMDAVLEAFGPGRLMFGSDWPVCTLASTYERWHRLVEEWAAPLSGDERAALFGGTAAEVYGLAPA